MKPNHALVMALIVAISGCSSASKAKEQRFKQRIEALAQKDSASQRQIEELNNRLFLLEGKLKKPKPRREPNRLPVVRLRPETPPYTEDLHNYRPVARTPQPSDGRQGTRSIRITGEPDPAPIRQAAVRVQANQYGRSVVANENVELSGAALREGPRPVLKLRGRGGRVSAGSSLPTSTPLRVNERLPVVPIARKRIAKRIAKAAPLSPVAKKAYEGALSQYRNGRYAAAAAAFRAFVAKYAKHAYADNALYWLGECFYDLKQYRLSLKMFRRVVEEYPTANKAPAALLKMGFSYMKLQDKANAKTVLSQVKEIFPGSRVARLASKTLATLR